MRKENFNEIRKAIKVFLNSDLNVDNFEEKLTEGGVKKNLINDLFIFIPIVFCRQLLPNINFKDYFIDENDLGKRKRFDSLTIYKEIDYIVSNEVIGVWDGSSILKVAGISSEFNAINNLLLETDGNMNDINFTEMIIIR